MFHLFGQSVLLPTSPQRRNWSVNVRQPLSTQIGPRLYAFGKLLMPSLLLADKLRALLLDSADIADLDDTEPVDLLLLSEVKTAGPAGDAFSSGLPLVRTASGARNPAETLPYWSDHMLIVLGILRMFGVNNLFILMNSLCRSSSSRLEKHRCSHRHHLGLHHNHITHFIHVTFIHVTFFCLHVTYIDVFHIHVISSMSLSPAGMSFTPGHSYPCHFVRVIFILLHVTHTHVFNAHATLSMSLSPAGLSLTTGHSYPCHFGHVIFIRLHVTHNQVCYVHVTSSM